MCCCNLNLSEHTPHIYGLGSISIFDFEHKPWGFSVCVEHVACVCVCLCLCGRRRERNAPCSGEGQPLASVVSVSCPSKVAYFHLNHRPSFSITSLLAAVTQSRRPIAAEAYEDFLSFFLFFSCVLFHVSPHPLPSFILLTRTLSLTLSLHSHHWPLVLLRFLLHNHCLSKAPNNKRIGFKRPRTRDMSRSYPRKYETQKYFVTSRRAVQIFSNEQHLGRGQLRILRRMMTRHNRGKVEH